MTAARVLVSNEPRMQSTMPDQTNIRAKSRRSYPFRLQDPVSGIWVKARFIAGVENVPDCLAAWEIMAAPKLATKPQ
jgi:hypothetical protein